MLKTMNKLYCAALLCTSASLLSAVQIDFDGPGAVLFGASAVVIQDINSDGRKDYAIAAPGDGTGKIRLYDAATLSIVRTIDYAGAISQPFGLSVSELGRNYGGGSTRDIIAFSPFYNEGATQGAGRLIILDPETGLEVAHLASPSPEASGGFGWGKEYDDANGDTIPDLLVAAPGENGGRGRVYLLSGGGTLGQVIHTFNSPNPEVGASLTFGSILHDLNNDGKREIHLWAADTVSGQSRAGRAYIFDGATYNLMHTLSQPIPSSDASFGPGTGIDDITGDGVPDVAVAAPAEGLPSNRQGVVYLFSGANGALIDSIPSTSSFGLGFGYSIVKGPDMDNDGKGDLYIGDYLSSIVGQIQVYSTATRNLVGTITQPVGSNSALSGVAVVEDFTGDSIPDIAALAPSSFASRGTVLFLGSEATLSVAPVNTGSQPISVTRNVGVEIRNDGLSVATLGALTFTGADSGDFGVVSVPATIPALSSDYAVISFTPSAEGSREATLNIGHGGSGSPFTVSVSGTGFTPLVGGAQGILYVAYGSRIAAVDLANGDRQIIASSTVGSGAFFIGPYTGVAAEAGGASILAVQTGSGNFNVVRIDTTTLVRTVVSSPVVPVGTGFVTEPGRGIALAGPNTAYCAMSGNGLLRVDLATGDRTYISSTHPPVGSGPDFFTPFDVCLDESGNPVVADVSNSGLYRVNPANGARTRISSGPGAAPYSVALLFDGDFVTGSNGDFIMRVNKTTGATTTLSGGLSPTIGTGPQMENGQSATVHPVSGEIIAFDGEADVIFLIHPSTGNRSVISGWGDLLAGTGPALSNGNVGFEDVIRLAIAIPGELSAGSWAMWE